MPKEPNTGLETLTALAAQVRDGRSASIMDLFDMRFELVSFGHVEISMATRDNMRNPMGTLHGGACATLLDSVVGCAVHSTLPTGASYTTLEIKVNYIRSVATDGQRLHAVGRTTHVGRHTATAHGEVRDENGKLIAHASTTCLIFAAAVSGP